MSLNNQIFSLRQAIIKAKRMAKQQSSSSQQQYFQEPLSQQQSINEDRQTKRILKNNKSNQKSAIKLLNKNNNTFEKQSPVKQKTNAYSHKKSNQKAQRSNQKGQIQFFSIDAQKQKISSLAKNVYNQRKKALSNSKTNTISQIFNFHQESPDKKSPHKSTMQEQSRTHNKKINDIAGSRVSNFTINSQASKKANIADKLNKLRSFQFQENNTKPQLSKHLINQQYDHEKNQLATTENIQNYQQNIETQNNINQYADYQVKESGIIKYRSLFQNYSHKHKNQGIVSQNNSVKQINKDQLQSIHNVIQMWRDAKNRLRCSFRVLI